MLRKLFPSTYKNTDLNAIKTIKTSTMKNWSFKRNKGEDWGQCEALSAVRDKSIGTHFGVPTANVQGQTWGPWHSSHVSVRGQDGSSAPQATWAKVCPVPITLECSQLCLNCHRKDFSETRHGKLLTLPLKVPLGKVPMSEPVRKLWLSCLTALPLLITE